MKDYKVHAEWSADCQGKWDYDCGLVQLSCRYWPRGGGFFVISPAGFEENENRPEIKHSAKASVCIGNLVNGPYEEIVSEEFDGDFEDEVKAKVEAWAQIKCDEIIDVLKRHFAKEPPP